MAYDSAADRTVLFGGYELDVPGGVNDTWSYDFASNTWTNRTAAIAPGDRIDSYMAYDSAANRIVLFGGETSTGFLNDTWSYDFGTNTWTNVSTAIAPDQWLQPGMAYDSAADRSVVFADVWQPAYLIDVWSYDLTTDIWTNIGPGTKPLARAWHAMVYDSRADQTVVFGGACLGNVTGVLSNETLVYDFNTSVWMNMSPVKAPSARANLSMAYDSAADRIVLFGGLTAAWDILNDTWSYDLATNTWTNVSPTISPAARAWGAMVYDSAADRIVLFGGRTATGDVLNDTWSYDLATNTWTDLSPVVAPYQRSDFDMAYDSRADRVVLFGGRTPTEFFNDTWSYDLATNTWTDLNPVVAPSARIEPNMAYDAAADRIVLFGGMGTMSVLNDTWSYDLATNTWTNLSPSVSPLARFGFGMVYDSAADRTIIFGGFSFSVSSSFSGSLDDTWWYRFPEIPSAPQTLQASLGGALPAILAVVVVAAVVVALWVLVSRKRRTPPEEPAKSEEPPK
jgi:N-acetylneuraminic acid mutarotase